MQNIVVDNCKTGLTIVGGAGGSMSTGQGIGSLHLTDLRFHYVNVAVSTSVVSDNSTALLLSNSGFYNVDTIVQDAFKNQVLLRGGKGTVDVDTWVFGRVTSANGTTAFHNGANLDSPVRNDSLVTGGRKQFFPRRRPKYDDLGFSQILDAKAYGAKGDGKTDDTAVLNHLFSAAANMSAIVYVPFGVYIITDTVEIPVGLRVIGQAWPQIMAAGSKFADGLKPRVAVRVGLPGQVGVVEIQNMIMTVKVATAGALMMEVGGAAGTNLTIKDCPKLSGKVNPNCVAASLMLHLTSDSSGYFENGWIWTADHDFDTADQTQINIFVGRDLQVMCYGLGFAHYRLVSSPHSECWPLLLLQHQYDQTCLNSGRHDCQDKIFYTEQSYDVWVQNLVTLGSIEMASPLNGVPTLGKPNQNGFASSILAWLGGSKNVTGQRDFEGYMVHSELTIGIEDFSNACQNALTALVDVDSICDKGCAEAISDWLSAVGTYCGDSKWENGAAAGTIGSFISYGINETCQMDKKTGKYCNVATGLQPDTIRLLNPWIHELCGNIQTATEILGRVICTTTPGGKFDHDANSTSSDPAYSDYADKPVSPPKGTTVAQGTTEYCGQCITSAFLSLPPPTHLFHKDTCSSDLIPGQTYCVGPTKDAFADRTPIHPHWRYGCYARQQDTGNHIVLILDESLYVFGLQNGDSCICDKRLRMDSQLLDDPNCNIHCNGNTTNICGGVDAVQVFSDESLLRVEHVSLGCFIQNDSKHVLDGETIDEKDMSVDKCAICFFRLTIITNTTDCLTTTTMDPNLDFYRSILHLQPSDRRERMQHLPKSERARVWTIIYKERREQKLAELIANRDLVQVALTDPDEIKKHEELKNIVLGRANWPIDDSTMVRRITNDVASRSSILVDQVEKFDQSMVPYELDALKLVYCDVCYVDGDSTSLQEIYEARLREEELQTPAERARELVRDNVLKRARRNAKWMIPAIESLSEDEKMGWRDKDPDLMQRLIDELKLMVENANERKKLSETERRKIEEILELQQKPEDYKDILAGVWKQVSPAPPPWIQHILQTDEQFGFVHYRSREVYKTHWNWKSVWTQITITWPPLGSSWRFIHCQGEVNRRTLHRLETENWPIFSPNEDMAEDDDLRKHFKQYITENRSNTQEDRQKMKKMRKKQRKNYNDTLSPGILRNTFIVIPFEFASEKLNSNGTAWYGPYWVWAYDADWDGSEEDTVVDGETYQGRMKVEVGSLSSWFYAARWEGISLRDMWLKAQQHPEKYWNCHSKELEEWDHEPYV
ncbi:putative glucan 1 3-beta-glucosidase [Fusarium sp. NRRL 52700]|nr:putative glucan 1 3-beta-glucosidase [Fusarium sp. NRRL 52700]